MEIFGQCYVRKLTSQKETNKKLREGEGQSHGTRRRMVAHGVHGGTLWCVPEILVQWMQKQADPWCLLVIQPCQISKLQGQ